MRLPNTVLTPEPVKKPDSELVQKINSMLHGRKLSNKSKELFTKRRFVDGVKVPSLEDMWANEVQRRELIVFIDLLKLKNFFKQAASPEHVANTLMGYNGKDALPSPIDDYDPNDEFVEMK